MTLEELQTAMIELQTKVQFQEDALHKLDEVVIQQSHTIDQLTRRLVQLEDKLEQVADQQPAATNPADERPPHY